MFIAKYESESNIENSLQLTFAEEHILKGE